MTDFKTDPRIAGGMAAQRRLRQTRLDAGAKLAGWKVGFGAPAAMEKLRLDGPLAGFMLDRAVLQPGAAVSLKGWQKPVAEPEIAVYLGRDIPAGAGRDTVRAAIAAIGPAIELADIDCPMDDVEAILGGDIFQRHVVFGPRDATRAGARLENLTGHVTRSGKDVPVPQNLEANTGEIVGVVGHLANVLAHFGDGLRAGQFVITGAVVPPIFLEAGDDAVEWRLEPLGAVSVRLTH